MANPVSPASVIRGQRGIANETASQLVPDVLPRIIKYQPNRAPFLTALRMLKKTRTTNNRKYDLWEMPPAARFVTVLTDSTTSITVSTADGNQVPDFAMLYNHRTGEVRRVTANSSGTLTTTAGWGGTASTTWVAGDQVKLIGTAYADGAVDGTAINWIQNNGYNYTQIFKDSVEATRRARVQKRYGGYTIDDDRIECGLIHKERIQGALLFGRRNSTGTPEITTTGGLYHYITTNVTDFGGNRPSKRAFIESMEPAFRYGEGAIGEDGMGEKHILCSPAWMGYFDEIFENQIKLELFQLSEPERRQLTIGWHVSTVVTTHGKLHLHRMQDWADEAYRDLAIGFDPNHLRMVYLEGGQTKALKNREAVSTDGSKDTLLTDCGIDLEVEPAHWVSKGLGF